MRYLVVVAALVGCDGGGTGPAETDATGDTEPAGCEASPYAAFGDAGADIEAQIADHAQISALVGPGVTAGDFATMSDLYLGSSGLAASVTATPDRHTWASVPMPGDAMDSILRDALGRGASGNNMEVQANVVDITLQRYFALTVYDRLTTSQREAATEWNPAWDQGFAAFGATAGGEAGGGPSAEIAARDAEYGTDLLGEAHSALVAGACDLHAGDSAALAAHADAVDIAVMRGFGASIVHEMDVYDEDAWVHWWTALSWWKVVFDYAGHVDPGRRDAIQAQFDQGSTGMDPAAVKADLQAIFAL